MKFSEAPLGKSTCNYLGSFHFFKKFTDPKIPDDLTNFYFDG